MLTVSRAQRKKPVGGFPLTHSGGTLVTLMTPISELCSHDADVRSGQLIPRKPPALLGFPNLYLGVAQN